MVEFSIGSWARCHHHRRLIYWGRRRSEVQVPNVDKLICGLGFQEPPFRIPIIFMDRCDALNGAVCSATATVARVQGGIAIRGHRRASEVLEAARSSVVGICGRAGLRQRLCRLDNTGRKPGIIRPGIELIEHAIRVWDMRVIPTRRTHAGLGASANRAVGRCLPAWLRTACPVIYTSRFSASGANVDGIETRYSLSVEKRQSPTNILLCPIGQEH